MKIYIVTQGEYSDYHIVATFSNKEIAYDFAKKMNSRIKGYSNSFEVEEHDIYESIEAYRPKDIALHVFYRSDKKELFYENEYDILGEIGEKLITVYDDKEFYIATMYLPMTVKKLLGAEKIMMDWVAQIEDELQNTFNGDLKAFKKHYNKIPF